MNWVTHLPAVFRQRRARSVATLLVIVLIVTTAWVAAQPSSDALAGGSFIANGNTVTLNFGKAAPNATVTFFQSADRRADARDVVLGTAVMANAATPQSFVLGTDLNLPNDAGDAADAEYDYYILAKSSAGTLALVGLYQYNGGSIFVHGSSGADVVTARDSGDAVVMTFDGALHSYASSSFKGFAIRTHDGNDRIDLSGVVGHRGPTDAWAEATLRGLNDTRINAMLDAKDSPMSIGQALVERAYAINGELADTIAETIGVDNYKALEYVDCYLFANGGAQNGGPGNDILTGTADNDRLFGNGGDDTLSGLGGCDKLNGGANNDSLDGGADKDWAMYNDSPSRVVVDLTGALATTDGWGGTDTIVLATLENVWGSAFNDRIIGDTADNRLLGDAGNDTILGNVGDGWIEGGFGNDNLRGNDGNDLIEAGDGDDIIQGQNDNDTITGGYGNDNMIGGAGYDDMMGGVGADFMNGHFNDDIMSGGFGDDVMWCQAGTDRLDGNEDNDTLYGADDTCTDDLAIDRLHGNVGTDTAYAAVASAFPDDVLTSVETTIPCP